MPATVKDFSHPDSQAQMLKDNAESFDPRIDINLSRPPMRYIYVFSVSKRSFVVDRAPLWSKFRLRACPENERVMLCASIPDPLMQMVHSTETGRMRAEANDGWRAAIDLLNPNNPTNNPDFVAPGNVAGLINVSRNCNLFAQGVFLSLSETPTNAEISRAEERRDDRFRALIAQADSLEAVNRVELEGFLKSEDGADVRMALDQFGEQRAYHKPLARTRTCPNCGEAIKSAAGFHRSESLGVLCVNDWQAAVRAGVKQKSDVPDELRWWADEVTPEPKRGVGRPRTSE